MMLSRDMYHQIGVAHGNQSYPVGISDVGHRCRACCGEIAPITPLVDMGNRMLMHPECTRNLAVRWWPEDVRLAWRRLTGTGKRSYVDVLAVWGIKP